jgi:hypothetical protein
MLVLSSAFAQDPDSLPSAERLAAAALAGVAGPAGCAAFTGTVDETNHALGLSSSRHFTWSAALDHGRWSRWVVPPVEGPGDGISISFGVDDYDLPFVPPFFGSFGAADADDLAGETRAMLHDLLAVASTRVELETVEPADDGTIVYRRELESRWALFGRKENVVQVWFDPATLRPLRWDVQIEAPVHLGEPGEGRITHLALQLAVDADGWPTVDTVDATGAFGVLALRAERTVTFLRGACTSAP